MDRFELKSLQLLMMVLEQNHETVKFLGYEKEQVQLYIDGSMYNMKRELLRLPDPYNTFEDVAWTLESQIRDEWTCKASHTGA